MATPENPIRFFDIASGPPVQTYAPNPWKTRYALNAKRIPYKTSRTPLPSIKSVRQSHNIAPVRKLPDSSDFYTLPMIHDAATSTWIGDSFDIAVYLDRQYPDSGVRLFPPGSVGVHRAFNAYVDALVSRHTAEESNAEFVRRAGVSKWEDLIVDGETREKLMQGFEAEMEEFSKVWKGEGGPFLEGKEMSYAEIIVGGWLGFLKRTLKKEEWGRVCEWQGGRWKKLDEALEQWAEVK
ncbi:glutathione S-transferas-like protein [Aulographum hederae CBS 113979]|uniref:Glutathione S-transferas-like protein n=1 Tax=Aulographum hederae CBS 113979 TaxID=1176131 RepID=A0A6G1H7V1_9PEZI|nr:glutathione S-transferas-like protein [Aulographum hederae CBS 113979]